MALAALDDHLAHLPRCDGRDSGIYNSHSQRRKTNRHGATLFLCRSREQGKQKCQTSQIIELIYAYVYCIHTYIRNLLYVQCLYDTLIFLQAQAGGQGDSPIWTVPIFVFCMGCFARGKDVHHMEIGAWVECLIARWTGDFLAPTVSQFESLNQRRNRIGMISLLTGFQELDFECFCPFKQTGLCLRALCRCHDNSQRLPMHKPNEQTNIIQNTQQILQEASLWYHSNPFDFGHFRTSWQSSYWRDPVWEPDFSIAKCDHHFRR